MSPQRHCSLRQSGCFLLVIRSVSIALHSLTQITRRCTTGIFFSTIRVISTIPHAHLCPLSDGPRTDTFRPSKMEPVPETERMEEFRPSPLPNLRIQSPTSSTSDHDGIARLQALRRSTDPIPSSPKSPSWYSSAGSLPYRPRTTSPLAGASSHTRSRSAASLAIPLSRTQSLPGVNGAGHILYPPPLARPVSPSHPPSSPNRVRPPRKVADEAFPPDSPVRMTVLDESDRKMPETGSSATAPPSSQITVSRHRRPASPFRHFTTSSAMPIPSSPSYRSADSYPGGYGSLSSFASSSISSTPSSARSRSPSISSLETIPDSPDAEEAALEAERIARLKAEAEAAENAVDCSDSADAKSRTSVDVPPRGRTLSFGSRDKRKRWSVCGAERRGDIDLETIWED